MTETLVEKTCTPCRGGIPPLTRAEAEERHCHIAMGASAKRRRFRVFQAAATAVRHVSIATARSARCVRAEVR